MKEPLIKIENLHYYYEEGRAALDGIDLEIYEGEKIAVLGSNGAGKSTFFLNLNGVLQPGHGTLYYRGEQIGKKNRKLLCHKVGLVFQDPDSQIIASSVASEISFGPMNLQLDKTEVHKRVMEAINYMNLQGMEERPPHYLSGGEKKRVTIADILAVNPEVIVFDEPTSSLDPMNAEILEGVLNAIASEGKTLLVSTHDVDFAYRFADRVIVFAKGRILADGTPQEVFVQEKVMRQAHLKKPLLMQVYDALLSGGIVSQTERYPVNLTEFCKTVGATVREENMSEYETLKKEGAVKRAILAVSFGTSYDETRKKTIDRIEDDIRARYTQYELYRAWTSKMIRKKIQKRDGIHIFSVSEALEQMERDGIREVIIQPTHVINGIENEQMTADAEAFRNRFDRLGIGTPLLTTAEDNYRVIQIVAEELHPAPDEALVLMGHGTDHFSNTIYAALDYQFKDQGYSNIFMGTVEAYPTLESLKRQIRKSGLKKVILAPFMIVAGDHATNDLSGEEDSWKTAFEEEGYEVRCVLRGLGEYEEIRELFMEHIETAIK